MGTFQFRCGWPRGVPVVARATLPDGVRFGEFFVELNGEGDARWVQGTVPVGHISWRPGWDDGTYELGVPDRDGRLRYSVTVQDKGSEDRIIAEQFVALTIKDSIDQCIQPVKSTELDRRIASARVGLYRLEYAEIDNLHGPRKYAHSLWLELAPAPEFEGVTLAIRAEILRGEDVIGAAEFWNVRWWRDRRGYISLPETLPGLPTYFSRVPVEADLREVFEEEVEGYRVRLSGAPEVALRDPAGTKYWDGTVVIPEAQIIRKVRKFDE